MKHHIIAAAVLSVALGVATDEVQALSAYVQTNAVEREVRAADQTVFEGEAVSVKLGFVRSGSDKVTRVLQLFGAAERARVGGSDDPYQYNNLALSQEVRRWSDTKQRYAFLSYGLSVAQYDLPQVSDVDLFGYRLGGGIGVPLFRNRVILTTDLNVQLLQQIGADDNDSREAELGSLEGKIGLLWSFDNVGITASYSYRYLNYVEDTGLDVADVSQMLGIGIGFALD